jgi:hypothetical protein
MVLVVSFCYTTPFHAEQSLTENGYTIHYNAFNSAMLTPEIASQYSIKRSSSLGVINVAILTSSQTAVTSFLDGVAKNNLSQQKELNFKKVTEGEAIYYISTFKITDKEFISFDFYVVPENETQKIVVRFKQQFFTDK